MFVISTLSRGQQTVLPATTATVKLGRRRKDHNRRATLRHYSNQPTLLGAIEALAVVINLYVDLRSKLYCVPGGGGGGADGGAGRGCPHGGEEAVQQVGGGRVLAPGQKRLLNTPDDRVTFPGKQVQSQYTHVPRGQLALLNCYFSFHHPSFQKLKCQ